MNQDTLPWPIRVGVVVPATVGLIISSGLLFTLPPGPLCDEGMVLYAGLAFTNHWTWTHTMWVAGTLAATGLALDRLSRRHRPPRPTTSVL
jgi:membrane-bound metal-dependent hydrolase YbcI (DUF457 family)